MIITNKENLPAPLVQAIQAEREDYTPDPFFPKGDTSVSKLLAPPRQVALIGAHKEEIVEDAADRVWALFGQLTHKLLEIAGIRDTTADHELKVATEILGWRVTGKIDRVDHIVGLIQDWKLTSSWSIVFGAPTNEWEKQLNLYRYLYEATYPNRPAVKRLEAVVFLRDWSKGDAFRNENYPQSQVQVIPIRLWSQKEAEDFLLDRVQQHQDAQQAMDNDWLLEPCTEADRWIRTDKFAIMKKGRKTAIRVFKTEEEAKAHMDKEGLDVRIHTIEARKTGPRRCQDYCAAAPWCDQYQSELAEE